MARRRRRKNLRYAILAVVISAVLWGIAHGSSSVERGYDIPVAFEKLPADLVIVDQSDSEINIRVLGSRAALRNLSPTKWEYAVNVSGAKPGHTVHEIDVSQLEMPRGVRVVSRSPAQLDVRFERKGRKNVRVRPDLEGAVPEGFVLGAVEVVPPRVWLTGARSRVLRLSEVLTETIDLASLEASTEREVRLSLGGDRVWMEEDKPVKVRIEVLPKPETAGGAAAAGGAGRAG